MLSVNILLPLTEPRSVVDRESLLHMYRGHSEQHQAFLREEEDVARLRELLMRKERYALGINCEDSSDSGPGNFECALP
jgi:hypothetical protein